MKITIKNATPKNYNLQEIQVIEGVFACNERSDVRVVTECYGFTEDEDKIPLYHSIIFYNNTIMPLSAFEGFDYTFKLVNETIEVIFQQK